MSFVIQVIETFIGFRPKKMGWPLMSEELYESLQAILVHLKKLCGVFIIIAKTALKLIKNYEILRLS